LGIMAGYEKIARTFAEYGQKLHGLTRIYMDSIFYGRENGKLFRITKTKKGRKTPIVLRPLQTSTILHTYRCHHLSTVIPHTLACC